VLIYVDTLFNGTTMAPQIKWIDSNPLKNMRF